MTNRLRKLANEHDRLNRQIAIANRKSEFAVQVKSRYNVDKATERSRNISVEVQRQRQSMLNKARKEENESKIKTMHGYVQ